MAEIKGAGGDRLGLGERSREQLAAYFERCFAGWGKGVNMSQPTPGHFVETPMTPMELEARYIATEIGINIYQVCNSAAFAPVRIYNEIQRHLGPIFHNVTGENKRLRAALIEIANEGHDVGGSECACIAMEALEAQEPETSDSKKQMTDISHEDWIIACAAWNNVTPNQMRAMCEKDERRMPSGSRAAWGRVFEAVAARISSVSEGEKS